MPEAGVSTLSSEVSRIVLLPAAAFRAVNCALISPCRENFRENEVWKSATTNENLKVREDLNPGVNVSMYLVTPETTLAMVEDKFRVCVGAVD